MSRNQQVSQYYRCHEVDSGSTFFNDCGNASIVFLNRLRDKFRYKLLSATVERMLSTAGIEPRVRSMRQQVESITPSWLLVFHLYFFEQVKNQLPRWCSGLNLLLYALNSRFDPCCAQHSFRCCTKQLVSELVSQC